MPERLVKVDPPEDVERVADGELLLVEGAQVRHAAAHILLAQRVAHARTLEKGRDFIAALRVHIEDVVADAAAGERGIDVRLLAAVDELLRPLTGDAP